MEEEKRMEDRFCAERLHAVTICSDANQSPLITMLYLEL